MVVIEPEQPTRTAFSVLFKYHCWSSMKVPSQGSLPSRPISPLRPTATINLITCLTPLLSYTTITLPFEVGTLAQNSTCSCIFFILMMFTFCIGSCSSTTYPIVSRHLCQSDEDHPNNGHLARNSQAGLRVSAQY